MNRALPTAIITQLQTVAGMQYVNMWNNQFVHIEDRSQFSFPLPCAFVEFIDVRPQQLGNGVQVYEPLVVRIHWGLEKYNEPGAQDQVLEQFDLIQSIHSKLDGFKPTGASSFFRTAEQNDYDHTALNIGTLDYTTTYMDFQQEQPIGSIESIPPTELVIVPIVE